MSVDIKGTLDTFCDLAKQYVNNALDDSISAEVTKIVATAKELCPVGTGEIQKAHVDKYGFHSGLMRDSIFGWVNKEKHMGWVKVPTTGMKDPYYGGMVHFGTVKMTARPFLYQAQERHMNDFPAEFQQALKKEVPEDRQG